MRIRLVTCLALLVIAPVVGAEELVQQVDVAERIAATPGTPLQTIAIVAGPAVTSPVYALKGTIRFDSVDSEGYLQLDNHFGEKGTFFTKSLAKTGPMKALSGTSDWRQFVLPFDASSGTGTPTPEKLTLSVYLPGGGTVYIRDVALYQYVPGENPLGGAANWINGAAAGIIGGIAGSLLGVWGALVGVLASKGRARGFAIRSANILLILGVFTIIAGLVAVAFGKPYALYTLFAGSIVAIVTGSIRAGLPRRYEQIELQRMQALDA